MNPGTSRGTVLVVGARGFLGEAIVADLRQHGYRVLSGVRSPARDAGDERCCDLAAMLRAEQWRDTLEGVDAVVNAAGILRESSTQTFEAVHVRGPLALALACVERGIYVFVQISALGDPRDGEFVASKHRFDATLLELPLRAVVLRPSVVYATERSYGGTSLLRALAALPFGVWVPGDGQWRMQPLDARDLAEIVAHAIASDAAGAFDVGGPAAISLRDYQRQWRRWLRVPGERTIRVPTWLVSLQVWVAERFGRGPMGATIWRMLRRGNVTVPNATQRLKEAFGFVPRALGEVLSAHPSQVQDRWQARLYFLAAVLRLALIALWFVSALAGFLASGTQIAPFVGRLPIAQSLFAAKVAGGVDLLFAVWLASGWRTRWALAGMAACVLGYTIAFSLWSPASWLVPLGGLAKNLVVLPAIAVLWVLSDRR
jgi:uncharacterized protein YbjT (DUF2867 family)